MSKRKKHIQLSEEEIARRLAQSESGPAGPDILAGYAPQPPRPAAVLLPLLRVDGAWHLLFTRRTSRLVEHSGQVAFPGGRSDPGDASPEQTAVREAYEEIGLDPNAVRILGRLKPMHTITNYLVTPVVGAIPWPYTFQLASDEVSRVFTIPLKWLADPANYEIRQRNPPYLPRPIPVIYFSTYTDELLWGVSAQITLDFLKALRLL